MLGKQKAKRKLRQKIWLDDREKEERLAALLYNEIDRIIFDLLNRKELLFKLWTKERDRAPLIKTLSSRYYDLGFEQLALFPKDMAKKLDEFYHALEDFIFYVSYTEDMPQMLNSTFEAYAKDLESKSSGLLEALQKISGEKS